MGIYRYFVLVACLFIFQSLAYANDIEDIKKRVAILKSCYEKYPPGPEQEECKKEIGQMAAVFNCKKLPNQEKVACYKDLSDKGKEEASYELGLGYSGESKHLTDLPRDENEATKYKLLAYERGYLMAKMWYYKKYIPPQPYKWEIGMSKNQVLHSIAGNPDKRMKTTTSEGSKEIWFYPGAALYFGPDSNWGLLEMIQEQ